MTTGTVATRQATDLTQGHPAEMASALLSVIARAAADPSVDVDKMQRLLDMQLALMARAAEASFNQALARLQKRLPRITKRGMIGRGTDREIPYAKYEDICEIVLPLLYEEGFTVSYSERLTPAGNMMEIMATFRHIDGHHGTGSAFTPLTDDSGGKNKVQGGGSVYAYGQRYAFVKFLNLVMEGEDDDGAQGAMEPISTALQDTITALISRTGADEKRFLKFMKVESIKDILVGDYQRAIVGLNSRAKKS